MDLHCEESPHVSCTLDGVHLYYAEIQIDILMPFSTRLTHTYSCEVKLLLDSGDAPEQLCTLE